MTERHFAPGQQEIYPNQFNTNRKTEQATSNQKLTAQLEGFSRQQEKKLRIRMESFGLPLVNINKISYKPTQKGQEGLMGSFQPYTGNMDYYKSLEKLPAVAQDGVMIHETAHANSPFDPENSRLYSGDGAKAAAEHTMAVAKQSLETGVYINGYQKALADSLKAGEIDQRRFLEETWSILVEHRFTNPAHLTQVEKSQQAKSKNPVGIWEGIDTSLVSLIPNVNNPKELDEHISGLRRQVSRKKPLVLKNTTQGAYRLAA